MNEDYTEFRIRGHFNEPLIINELEQNLCSYLAWALLRIGAFSNVTTGVTDFTTLHKVDDRSYSGNRVYQSIRKDWIWESGVNYLPPTGVTTYDPLPVQVYVNNSLKTTGDSGFEHYIDYPLGRVVFDAPQTGTIKAQYSYRQVQVSTSNDVNGWFEINYDSLTPDDIQWSQNLTSGDYSLSSTNRMQLPAIVVEAVAGRDARPFELGTLVSRNKQDVLFHVIAQDRYTRNNITDILSLQKDKTIILYDTDKVYDAGLFPLDERGMKVDNPTMYPNLVNNEATVFRQAIFDKISVSEVKTQHPNLHWAVIRSTLEVIY